MLFRSVLSSDDRQRRRWQFVRACDGMSPLNFRSREYKERRRETERETEMDAGSRSPSRLYEIVARLAALPSSHWVACGVRMDWTDADTGLLLPDRAGKTQTLKGAEAHSLVHRQPQPHRRLFIWPSSSLCDFVSASSPDRLRQLVKPENTLLLPFAFLLLPSLDPPANELQLTPPAHPPSALSLSLSLHSCPHQSTFMRPLFHCAKNDRKQRCRSTPLTALRSPARPPDPISHIRVSPS